MNYHGDVALGETLYVLFTTRQSTGAPFTLAGTPAVSAYVDAGLTEITAGITLGVDHDARTGLNLLTIVATTGNGFAVGTDVSLVITAGTVNGVSVVGEVVGSFSIRKRSAIKALVVDTYAMIGQEAPTATPVLAYMIRWLYKLARNRVTSSATEIKVYADDGTTVDHKATHSEVSSVYDRGKIGTGP